MNKSDKTPMIIDAQGKGLRALKGTVLEGKYSVGKCIDTGSYGKIHDC